ncbi:hypothetical protein STCU_12120 [Strigomonas culicis]|uniref:Uncharacterized protein n=1 Tax=Strigomonas culicis TaxID=28005 RepID=S9TBD1_9TRYP|nr:hypothetical protein STCU_12120 [Strigomonas culicis]|eukprot:EPY15322.1 hypothetical protein STCU_12120 [Strigomonas culicis]
MTAYSTLQKTTALRWLTYGFVSAGLLCFFKTLYTVQDISNDADYRHHRINLLSDELSALEEEVAAARGRAAPPRIR